MKIEMQPTKMESTDLGFGLWSQEETNFAHEKIWGLDLERPVGCKDF